MPTNEKKGSEDKVSYEVIIESLANAYTNASSVNKLRQQKAKLLGTAFSIYLNELKSRPYGIEELNTFRDIIKSRSLNESELGELLYIAVNHIFDIKNPNCEEDLREIWEDSELLLDQGYEVDEVIGRTEWFRIRVMLLQYECFDTIEEKFKILLQLMEEFIEDNQNNPEVKNLHFLVCRVYANLTYILNSHRMIIDSLLELDDSEVEG